jgi:hypothetical protein
VTNGNDSIRQKIVKNDIVTTFFTILKFVRDIVDLPLFLVPLVKLGTGVDCSYLM